MPIYVYRVANGEKGCSYCSKKFQVMQKISEKPLRECPKCKKPVNKTFSSFSSPTSKTTFDRKAKEKGFHKLKRVDKGKYEKLY